MDPQVLEQQAAGWAQGRRPARALEAFRQARELYRRMGNRPAVLRCILGAAEALCALARREEARVLLGPYLEPLETEADPLLRARGMALGTALAAKPGEAPSAALETARTILTTLGEAGATPEVGRAAALIGDVLRAAEHWEGALAVYGVATRVLRQAGEPAQLVAAALGLSQALEHIGRLPEADEAVREAVEAAQSMGDREAITAALTRALEVATRLALSASAVRWLRELADLALHDGDTQGAFRYTFEATKIAIRRAVDGAEHLVGELVALMPGVGPLPIDDTSLCQMAWQLVEKEQPEAARTLLHHQAELAQARAWFGTAGACLVESAEIALEQGDRGEFETLYRRAIAMGTKAALPDTGAWQTRLRFVLGGDASG